MALRALTPSGATYCSECGADAPRTADACAVCGRPFQGDLEAKRCPFCGGVLLRSIARCYHCGISLPPEAVPTEASFFRSVMDSTSARSGPLPESSGDSGSGTPPAASPANTALVKFSEPFQKVLLARKKRVVQMDALVALARRRIRMLEPSHHPAEVREREELKRQIEEVLLEREDILRIEKGILEMERIYRNILEMEQSQLREREVTLQDRIEAFRKDVEQQEQDKALIKEKKDDLHHREEELRKLAESFRDRERELVRREEQMTNRIRELEEQGRRLANLEENLKMKSHPPELTTGGSARTAPQEITIRPPDAEIRDLKLRISELEENMERVVDERNRLAEEQHRLAASQEGVKEVLRTLDELLGMLPDAEIRKFAKSKGFAEYEKILDEHGL